MKRHRPPYRRRSWAPCAWRQWRRCSWQYAGQTRVARPASSQTCERGVSSRIVMASRTTHRSDRGAIFWHRRILRRTLWPMSAQVGPISSNFARLRPTSVESATSQPGRRWRRCPSNSAHVPTPLLRAPNRTQGATSPNLSRCSCARHSPNQSRPVACTTSKFCTCAGGALSTPLVVVAAAPPAANTMGSLGTLQGDFPV